MNPERGDDVVQSDRGAGVMAETLVASGAVTVRVETSSVMVTSDTLW